MKKLKTFKNWNQLNETYNTTDSKYVNIAVKGKKGFGYWDVTKYPYGGDFKRFGDNDTGIIIDGTIKSKFEVRIKLDDNRTIVANEDYVEKINGEPLVFENKLNERKEGDKLKHKHQKGLTIKLLSATKKGWKVEQTELYKGWSDTKLKSPKIKKTSFSDDELSELFENLNIESKLPNGVIIDTTKTKQTKQEILEMYHNEGYTTINGNSLISPDFQKHDREKDVYILVGKILDTPKMQSIKGDYMEEKTVATQNHVIPNVKIITNII